jgi:hypothetical protein
VTRENDDLEAEVAVMRSENAQLSAALDAQERLLPSLLEHANAHTASLSQALDDVRTLAMPEAGPALVAMLRAMMKQAWQDAIDASNLSDRLTTEQEVRVCL